METGDCIIKKLLDDDCYEVEISNWNGVAYLIKRERIIDFIVSRKKKEDGIYILYGETWEKNGLRTKRLYINSGMTKNNKPGVLASIITHNSINEKYWDRVFVFIIKNGDDWGESQLDCLKALLIHEIKNAKKDSISYYIENPDSYANTIDDELIHYIEGIKTIANALEYDFFKIEKTPSILLPPKKKVLKQPPTKEKNSSKVATNIADFERFLCSRMNKVSTAKCYINNYRRLAEWLKKNKYIQDNDDLMKMDCVSVEAFCEKLLQDEDFKLWNREKHNNFSACLKRFIEYKKNNIMPTQKACFGEDFPKIGVIAQRVIKPLLSKGYFSDEDVNFMLSPDSGKHFKTDSSRPLLVMYTNVSLIYDSKMRARYSPHSFVANGKCVCIYTQLRNKGLESMVHFLNERGITNEEIKKLCS